MPSLVVTTSRSSAGGLHAAAQRWAESLGAAFVPRCDRSLATIAAEANVHGVLIVAEPQPTYCEPGRGLQYFFHPSMAKVRIHNLKSGRAEPMVTAMNLGPADEVLDCTLGRAADAIVASWIVGSAGRVVGIEKVPIIAQMTLHGLQHYEIAPADVAQAMRCIEVHQADYHDYLPPCPDDSFDIVYFDPIFDEPLKRSSAMAPLRELADHEPLSAPAIEQALRIARRRVVIKQRVGTDLWGELPFSVQVVSGTRSRVEYGIIVD